MSALMAMLGGGGGGGAPAVPPVANPEEAYSSQLQQLRDMGFFDQAENVRALQATGGNVNAAVERLLA
jgi:ubiquilin